MKTSRTGYVPQFQWSHQPPTADWIDLTGDWLRETEQQAREHMEESKAYAEERMKRHPQQDIWIAGATRIVRRIIIDEVIT